jgi:putative FmdB family regulatory protein
MPLFEFDCVDCGSAFEALVRGGESPSCPTCDSKELKKRLSVPAAPATKSAGMAFAGGCGDPSLPPCGAAHCGRLRRG